MKASDGFAFEEIKLFIYEIIEANPELRDIENNQEISEIIPDAIELIFEWADSNGDGLINREGMC